ncbi:MAG: hypothetical protein JXD19_06425, partial [Deltaproteobacteria bacterium]|nr:hypothetical protein [Deltaproteobacteria bacterium]
MKKGLLFVWLVMICLISVSLAADQTDSSTVVVYYFHTDFRCPSCHKIENYTKEAVEKYFGEDLESGRLIFLPINTDKEGQQHFISDYQLYTKSVV